MAIQTATITTTTQDFVEPFRQLINRIQEHSPSALRAGAFTIVTDTAGTVAFSYTDANGTYTKSIAAAVA